MQYSPYLRRPEVRDLPNKLEGPFDNLRILDEEKVLGPLNNRLVLEFTKQTPSKNDEPQLTGTDERFVRKIVIGNSKVFTDPKNEKDC